jgi:dTDP-4-dehydrorhamnose reductase
MRIVIVGAGGRLGAALARVYAPEFEVRGYTHADIDLTSLDRLRELLRAVKFDLLINSAALTNVDYCEVHRDEAFIINAEAPRILAELCDEKNAKLIHISTDYVFDGKRRQPYREEDEAIPISIYGESKREGEIHVLRASRQHLVARASWVFGPDRASFIDQVIQRARETSAVAAVADKFSTPTYTLDLARWLRAAWEKDLSGLLHLSNRGECSWQEYAQYAIDYCHQHDIPLLANRVGKLKLSEMKNFMAQRPVYTVLSTSTFVSRTGVEPRDWREAVAEYIRTHVIKNET